MTPLWVLIGGLTVAANPYAPIRDVNQCLDGTRVRDWRRVDDATVLVVSGKQYFRVTLSDLCPAVGSDIQARFFGSTGNRLCGRPGEAIELSGKRCGVAKVEPITREAYEASQGGAAKSDR